MGFFDFLNIFLIHWFSLENRLQKVDFGRYPFWRRCGENIDIEKNSLLFPQSFLETFFIHLAIIELNQTLCLSIFQRHLASYFTFNFVSVLNHFVRILKHISNLAEVCIQIFIFFTVNLIFFTFSFLRTFLRRIHFNFKTSLIILILF